MQLHNATVHCLLKLTWPLFAPKIFKSILTYLEILIEYIYGIANTPRTLHSSVPPPAPSQISLVSSSRVPQSMTSHALEQQREPSFQEYHVLTATADSDPFCPGCQFYYHIEKSVEIVKFYRILKRTNYNSGIIV